MEIVVHFSLCIQYISHCARTCISLRRCRGRAHRTIVRRKHNAKNSFRNWSCLSSIDCPLYDHRVIRMSQVLNIIWICLAFNKSSLLFVRVQIPPYVWWTNCSTICTQYTLYIYIYIIMGISITYTILWA